MVLLRRYILSILGKLFFLMVLRRVATSLRAGNTFVIFSRFEYDPRRDPPPRLKYYFLSRDSDRADSATSLPTGDWEGRKNPGGAL